MPLKAIARMIQTMLYGRRFFPYYVYNILGGIEADGTLPPLFALIASLAGVGTLVQRQADGQERVQCTPTTQSDHTSVKHVALLEPRNPSCNPSSTTRYVHHRISPP